MPTDISEIDSRIEIIPYTDLDEGLHPFDCGKNWFNEFINTKEIEEYHQEQFGITRLAYIDGELAGFYSLSANALRDRDYEGNEMDTFDELTDYPYDIPAYLLGHLAVAKDYQGEDIGKFLLFRAIAQSKKSNIPFRIMLLHAHEDVVNFYKKYGFVTSESKEGYPQIMFMDLTKISDPE